MGNGMFLDLRGRRGRTDRRFFNYRATVLIPMVLLTTVSCSTLPIDILAFDECDLSSGIVTEEQVLQVAPSKVRRSKYLRRFDASSPASATPKVVPVRATNATSRSGSGDASKKANTPPRLDVRNEQQLFNEFLEWRIAK
jgi:hypothetical protein